MYDAEAMQPLGYNWDHNSRYAGVSKNPYVKWTYQTKAASNLQLVIDREGTVITTSSGSPSLRDSEIYAVSPDGSLKWKLITNQDSVLYTSPVISADQNFIMQNNYSLWKINNVTGVLSSFTDSFMNKINYFYEPVIGRDGTIYTAGVGYTSALIAFSPDGKMKWSKGLSPTTYYKSDMSLSNDGTLYFKSSGTNALSAYNSVNGNKLWDYKIKLNGKFGVGTVPAIGIDGTIYITDASGYIHAINPDGSLKWKSELPNSFNKNVVDPVVGKDGSIYVSHPDKNLYSYDSSGNLKWVFNTSSVVSNPLIDVNNIIYIVEGMNVKAINSMGQELWSYTLDWVGNGSKISAAIASDGTIYVQDNKGKLYAIGGEVQDNTPNDPSPDEEQHGLNAEYYNNDDLTDKKLDRIDSNIDFDWGLKSPDAIIDPETYSVRWIGKILPERTDRYNFYIYSDDGARLWVNNELIIGPLKETES